MDAFYASVEQRDKPSLISVSNFDDQKSNVGKYSQLPLIFPGDRDEKNGYTLW